MCFRYTITCVYLPQINNNTTSEPLSPLPFTLLLCAFHSGSLGITNWVDRILGQLSACLRFSFIDGVNDHSASEYIRHFKMLVVNSKVSFFDKAKNIVKDTAKKMICFCLRDSLSF